MQFFKPAFCAAVALACGFGPILHTASAEEAEQSEDAKAVAARYGVRASVLDISLSPSGTKVAWISAGPGHSEILSVYDLDGSGEVQTIASNDRIETDLSVCDWATNERLVCELYGMGRRDRGLLVPYSRMFAIGTDGEGPLSMSERQSWRAMGFNQDGGDLVALDVAGEEGQILVTRNYVKENSIGTRMADEREGLGVDLFDVRTGKRRVAEQPDDEAAYYIADENGEVRVKARALTDGRGFLTGEWVYMVREAGKSRWSRLEDVTLGGRAITGFSPAAVDARENVLYAYANIGGYISVIAISLDGSGTAKVVASRDDVDIDSLIRIGRQRRVVGVSYATEKRSIQYFDPQLDQLASDLAEALPTQPLINIVGASSDEDRLLIIASSDTDPGTVYVYNKATRELDVLLAMRDFLVDQPMGPMKPVIFPASDGTEIPGYLTLPAGSEGKNLPAIVLPHGGPAARDEWGFDWLVQFFVARGYAVLQPNYRGSSGYGEAWYGRNGFKAWDVAIGDVNDAGRWLVKEGIADPDKLVIAGWSYGGYAALQSQVVAPDLYKAVVAIAPVTDLNYLRSDSRDYTNKDLVQEFIGTGPHLDAGSPRRHADKFAAPVALFHATRDLNVDVRHSREMAEALEEAGKQVSYSEYEDLQHDLGDSNVRTEMLGKIDAFLEAAIGS